MKRATVQITWKTYFVYITSENRLKNEVRRVSSWSEVLWQRNQKTLKSSTNDQNNWKSLTNVLVDSKDFLRAFCKLFFWRSFVSTWSVKEQYEAKILLAIWQILFSYGSRCNFIPTNVVTNLLFAFFPVAETKKQELEF